MQKSSGKLEKATLQNLDHKDAKPFKCLFNPTEYSIAKTNNWKPKDVVGKNVPQMTFTGGDSKTLTMSLFFDVAEEDSGDVRLYIDQLWALVLIDEKNKNYATKRARPPLCLFEWGEHWQFTAVVTSLKVRYTLFSENGTPIRATADVTFREAMDGSAKKKTNPSSFAEPGRRRRAVQSRDTLASIAFEEYGDASRWRILAEENGLDDPLDLHAGQILAIPPVT